MLKKIFILLFFLLTFFILFSEELEIYKSKIICDNKIGKFNLSPDGNHLIYATKDSIKVLKNFNGKYNEIESFNIIGSCWEIIVSNNSEYIAISSLYFENPNLEVQKYEDQKYKIDIWKLSEYGYTKIKTFKIERATKKIGFSPDNKYFAYANYSNTISVYKMINDSFEHYKNYGLNYNTEVGHNIQFAFSSNSNYLALSDIIVADSKFHKGQKSRKCVGRIYSLSDTHFASIDINQKIDYFSQDSKYLICEHKIYDIINDKYFDYTVGYNNLLFVFADNVLHFKDAHEIGFCLTVSKIENDKIIKKNEYILSNSKINTGDYKLSPDGKYLIFAKNNEIHFWTIFFIINNSYVDNKIETFIQNGINNWQIKDEFEKTPEYLIRMKKRNEAINSLANNAIKKYANWVNIKILGHYDADSESYKINIPIAGDVILKVPISFAKDFKKNSLYLQMKNAKISSKNNNWFLNTVDIYDPINNRSFSYDCKNKSIYDTSPEFAFKFNDVIISNQHQQNVIDDYSISDIIPINKISNNDAIAVIIGNKDYKNTKEVTYALRDAILMESYLKTTFGFKEGNIFLIENATKSDFELYFGTKDNYKGRLYNAVKEDLSDIFVFYSGHGAPNLQDNKAYFVPIECDPNYIELQGYPLNTFYDNLSKIPAKSITVILEACFSGLNIYENISPPRLVIDNPVMNLDNGIVLTSSKDTEVSTWFNEKKHGMFTYFFLKAIHNKNADYNKDNKLTFEEIYQFVSDKTEGVPYYSRRIHGFEQHPQIFGLDKDRVLIEYE